MISGHILYLLRLMRINIRVNCKSAEISRMANIFSSDGCVDENYKNRPMLFIRYNPDNYKIGGKKNDNTPSNA